MHFKGSAFSKLSSQEEKTLYVLNEERAFGIFCDLASAELLTSEIKETLLMSVLQALENRLLALKENSVSAGLLKEALLFANVKLMESMSQVLDPSSKIAVSALILIKSKQYIFIAGAGDLHVYSSTHGFNELLFKDPLNKLSIDLPRHESLINALGTSSETYFHVKQVAINRLKELVVASFGAYTQLPLEKIMETSIDSLRDISLDEHDLHFCSLHLKNGALSTQKYQLKKNKIALVSIFSFAALSIAYLSSQMLPMHQKRTSAKNERIFDVIPKLPEKILVDDANTNENGDYFFETTVEETNELHNEHGLSLTHLKKFIIEKEEKIHSILLEKEQLALQHLQEVNFLKSEITKQASALHALQMEIAALKPHPRANDKPAASKRIHIVSQGDSLSSISLKYYGTSKRWEEIYEANKDILPSKNYIKAGMQLVIPPPQK